MTALKRIRLTVVATVAAFAGTAIADPIPVHVDPESASSSASIVIAPGGSLCLPACTAVATLSASLDGAGMDLDVGDTWEFDFFNIVVGGNGVVWDATVQATLGFAAPLLQSSGTGHGGFATFFGSVSGGLLEWDQPSSISLGDGTALNIRFENIFEGGLGTQTTVSATVSRVLVPEPATLGLLGAGLLSMVALRRRRVA